MHDNLWKMFSAYKTILKPNPEKSCYVKQVAKKNHETYFFSCIYINNLHMTMSLICLMEHFYIFFFNSQNPTFVIPNTLKYWRET